MSIRLALALSASVATATAAAAQQPPTLAARVAAKLAEAPAGTRIGLVVADDTGREIVAILPDQRFIPASNTKLVTTATAFATLTGLDAPDVAGGTSVGLATTQRGTEIILTGRGDARLSARPDCKVDCLATLADAVAAKARAGWVVRGDAALFTDQRWSAGMSWNNIPTESGTATAALSLDDNEIPFSVSPGAPGVPPVVAFGPENGPAAQPRAPGTVVLNAGPYYTIDNRATTGLPGSPTTLDYDRLPFDRTIRLTGSIAADAPPVRFRAGIDDPAFYAAHIFQHMLAARGVRLSWATGTAYRPTGSAPRLPEPAVELARLTPPPLAEDITIINKVSQNLHAELLLRRIGCARGDCSAEGGLKAVRETLTTAGLPRAAFDFSDGSGMSTYNRISPRGMVALLRWGAAQPWGKAWRDSFPVGGVDGTLAARFKGTALEGRIFAKTGAINATAALSGYMIARSGRALTFSILANDIPDGTNARPTMDAALVLIAENN